MTPSETQTARLFLCLPTLNTLPHPPYPRDIIPTNTFPHTISPYLTTSYLTPPTPPIFHLPKPTISPSTISSIVSSHLLFSFHLLLSKLYTQDGLFIHLPREGSKRRNIVPEAPQACERDLFLLFIDYAHAKCQMFNAHCHDHDIEIIPEARPASKRDYSVFFFTMTMTNWPWPWH